MSEMSMQINKQSKREPILVLCDREEEYAQLMTEFIRTHKEVPWKVHTYTDVEELLRQEQDCPIDVMAVSERTYQDKLSSLRPGRTVILNESGLKQWEEFVNVDKYQQAQNVLQSLLEVYLEIADIALPGMQRSDKVRFVGLYSPVRRCRQTTFALTLAQMLAVSHKTLYLNFEHYVGLSELGAETGERDLADLLYFLMTEDAKFKIRLQTIVRQVGNLDYVPPMKSGQNLLSVQPGEWTRLLQRIALLGEYEVVILDLSESMQGLFDLLRLCDKVFTLMGEDRIAQGKLAEYEQLLVSYEYKDVLEKTCKCVVPKVRRVPEEVEQYTRGELADFVKIMIRELEGDF